MKKKIFQMDINPSLLKIKQVLNTQDFIEIEFWAISDEYPTNNVNYFPLETMQKNIDDGNFYGKPVLGRFNNITQNYEVHNSKKKWDPEFNQEYIDYEGGERPIGFCHDPKSVRIEMDDRGYHWIVFSAVIWVKYNYNGVKKILKTNSGKISAEVSVFKSHKDENGVEIFDDWVFDGITILGYKQGTMSEAVEGIQNAHRTITDSMQDKIYSEDLLRIRKNFEKIDIKDNFYIDKIGKKGARILQDNEEIKNENFIMEKTETVADEQAKECNNEKQNECDNSKAEECNNTQEPQCNDEQIEDADKEKECNNAQAEECKNSTNKEEPEQECNNVTPNAEGSEECKNECGDGELVPEKDDTECNNDCGCGDESGNSEEECNNAEENAVMEQTFELVDGTQVDSNTLYSQYQILSKKLFELQEDYAKVQKSLNEYVEQAKQNNINSLKEQINTFVSGKHIDEAYLQKVFEQVESGALTDFVSIKKDIIFAMYEANEEKTVETEKHSFSAKAENVLTKTEKNEKTYKNSFDGLKDFIQK